jgi:hypothetical protein
MHDIIITPEGTLKLLKNLNPTKAIGPDKISPHFLKEVHDEISPWLYLDSLIILMFLLE